MTDQRPAEAHRIQLPMALARRIRSRLPILGVVLLFGGAALTAMAIWLSYAIPQDEYARSAWLTGAGMVSPNCVCAAGIAIVTARGCVQVPFLDTIKARRSRNGALGCCIAGSCAAIATFIALAFTRGNPNFSHQS